MVRKPLIHYHDYGLEFYEYLKKMGHDTISERGKLRKLYYDEFKGSGYGFSTVLYALYCYGKVKVKNGQQIIFTKKLQEDMRRRAQGLQMKVTEENRPEVIADKIKIYSTDHEFDKDGKMSLNVEKNTENTVYLVIENTATKPVLFTGYKPLRLHSNINLEDKDRVTQKNPLVLHPGSKYDVKVTFSPRELGVLSVKLTFEFKLERSSHKFVIVRFIEAQCMTALGKELAPTAPYRPPSPPLRIPEMKFFIEKGQPPQGMSIMRQEYKLHKSLQGLIPALKNPESTDKRKSILEASLNWENYAQKFRLLWDLEQRQMELDLEKSNIPNDDQQEATMERDRSNKELLILKVPGVIENRVSVQRWDHLLVNRVGTNIKYVVYVDSVQQDTLKLGYNKELLSIFKKGMKFNVEFTLNTLLIGIQRRAVRKAVETGLYPVLFPTPPASSAPQPTLPKLKLFDKKLEENPEQYRAVQHIVAGSSKPAPYLVFGPPGTGKTVTLAEAIKQILRLQPKSRVLACAPTNSATDQLCENILKHVDRSKVRRIYAKYINPSEVSSELKACSNLKGDIFDFPRDFKEELMQYKVIVTTLLTSSRIVTEKVPTGHFTHVFVDEAGHTVETQCILPLAGLLNPETGQVVLAGDPKQLGPIVKSPFALEFKLGLSLLERLMTDFPLYHKNKDGFDNRFVTKLLHNYRSHPAILKVPNELFYDDELKPFADEYQRNSYCKWEHLPQLDFPIIFHGVTGLEARESSSPSFFNITEVEVLRDYVKKLLQTQRKKGLSTLAPQDIGIIAPYWKQVQKIRSALRKVEEDFKLEDISSIKVGSVEEFQGQERRVILVSTVRSSPEYAELDKLRLEFVKNEKRFNVAVTRAKALLIVVGNPLVLRSDPAWKRFIDYCKDKGGYKGYDPEDTSTLRNEM